MKAKRLLFLIMAICLASGVKAQFHDSADDIYFYLEYSKNGTIVDKENQRVFIFNFDGKKACHTYGSPKVVSNNLKINPDYYSDLFENEIYDLEYTTSSYGICYEGYDSELLTFPGVGSYTAKFTYIYSFSSDRETLNYTSKCVTPRSTTETKYVFKKVEKSFFKVGRSKTPSGTLHE